MNTYGFGTRPSVQTGAPAANAIGLSWGRALFLVGVAKLIAAPYGRAFLDAMASVYPGYTAQASVDQVILDILYGVVDGAVGGAILAWLYEHFAKA
ncbi:MAG: hypothetical protein L0Y67_01940 [Gammaproteobacteria bacterium]|nr:hypothetical protein [Gammaproteobacteria bacterium]MCI0590360.1 hypothetical protein [Gammaproteobacteria bacterium]